MNELKKYLKDMIIQSCWESIERKARAIFTTIYTIYEYEQDDSEEFLKELYNDGYIFEIVEFEEYRTFMRKDLN